MNENLTMLIVDDEASICNGLSHAIPWKKLNINVIGTAKNGEEAFLQIQTCKPDIVITDIRMPRCDGLQLIEKVQKAGIGCKFIILSGYGDFKYAQTAMKFGVKSYLLKPIKKAELLEEVRKIQDEIFTKHKNIQSENVKEQIIAKGLDALRGNFLKDIIHNVYREESLLNRTLAKLDISLENTPSKAIVFKYDIPDKAENGEFTKNDAKLILIALKNVIAEIFAEIHCAVFDCDEYIVVIANLSSHGVKSDLGELCQKCVDSIFKYLHLSIFAGIGVSADGLTQIGESYQSAVEAVSYRIYGSFQTVFDSASIYFEQAPSLNPKNMDTSNIVDAILIGEKDKILNLIEQFFKSLLYIPMPPPSFVRGTCIYFVMDIQKRLSIYLDDQYRLTSQLPQAKINSFSSFRTLKEWITSLLIGYIDYMKCHGSLCKDPTIETAKNYIRDNLSQKLKVEDVASYVHLSENYFASYFKEKTNENFRSYMLRLKIEKAIELLKNSNKSISEISVLLGYEDYRSFNRVFKNATGRTPSDVFNAYHS